jgi:hypothetical protein
MMISDVFKLKYIMNQPVYSLGYDFLYNWYRVSFPAVKQPERGVDHPHPSSAEVIE